MHNVFKARLQKDPDSSCAFMAAAVIDQLLPGTTVRTGGQQLDVIVDAAAAEKQITAEAGAAVASAVAEKEAAAATAADTAAHLKELAVQN